MSLDGLPSEVLTLILSFCDMNSINSVSMTCKRLNEVTSSKYWEKCKCDFIHCNYLNRVVLARLSEKYTFDQILFTENVDFSLVDQDSFVDIMKRTSKMCLYYSFNNEEFDYILRQFGSNARESSLTELEIHCNYHQYQILMNDHFWDQNLRTECNLYFERIRLVCQNLEKKKGELVFLVSDSKDFVFNLSFVIHFDSFPHKKKKWKEEVYGLAIKLNSFMISQCLERPSKIRSPSKS